MAKPTPDTLARQLLAIIATDKDRLERIDDYMHGQHDDPYMPDQADDEYRLLAERSISNWMPLVADTPLQAMYVDGFRRGNATPADTAQANEIAEQLISPEWEHWQRSRMDARQIPVMRGALVFGHSFVVTEKTKKGVISRGLSAMKTSAVFEDAANDETPYAALTVTEYPNVEKEKRGKALLWDGTRRYNVTFARFSDNPDDKDMKVAVGKGVLHGANECPITRFACAVDLEGRTLGLIEPLITLQNRINQTVFDLLVAQTYGSFKVRTVTGMAPPLQMEPVYETDTNGDYVLDPNGEKIVEGYKPSRNPATGQPIPAPVNYSVKRFIFSPNKDAKFGSLDETPLGGYIESIDMSIRHLSAIAQVPPHHLLGQIANLSAEALQAAETSLLRKIAQFQKIFGEAWERVFRLAAELSDDEASANDFAGEVIWRDMEQKSMSQTSDALGKLKENLDIPAQGLWEMVPGVTQNQLAKWKQLAEEQDSEQMLADAMQRATSTTLGGEQQAAGAA